MALLPELAFSALLLATAKSAKNAKRLSPRINRKMWAKLCQAKSLHQHHFVNVFCPQTDAQKILPQKTLNTQKPLGFRLLK